MAGTSRIEWTDATWNPITGCTLVSEGCRHCYAARLAATRLRHHPSRAGLARVNAAGEAKFTGEVRFNEQWLDQPLRWGRPRMIFVCAHGDLFHEAVPADWIDRVVGIIARARHHVFQVLTKRPERMNAYMTSVDPARWIGFWSRQLPYSQGFPKLGVPPAPPAWPPTNLWLGTSVEDQATADARVPYLLATPAALRFLSAEPLLGPIDLTLRGRIHWVIAGGESGPGARPMHPEWARSLRDQCAAADIPFFFKQWGEWSADALLYRTPEGVCPPPEMRIGRARSGRRLDGRTHSAMPTPGSAA